MVEHAAIGAYQADDNDIFFANFERVDRVDLRRRVSRHVR